MQPILKPVSEYPGPVPEPPKPPRKTIGEVLIDARDKAIAQAADMVSRAAVNKALTLSPYLIPGLGLLPYVARGGKTPFPKSLLVGFPAGFFLQEAIISESGDEEIGGNADAVIAETLRRAEAFARSQQEPSPTLPMWDADP